MIDIIILYNCQEMGSKTQTNQIIEKISVTVKKSKDKKRGGLVNSLFYSWNKTVSSSSNSPAAHVKGVIGAKEMVELAVLVLLILADCSCEELTSTALVSVHVSGLQLFTPTHPKSSTSNQSACTELTGAMEATPTTIASVTKTIPRFLIFEFILVLYVMNLVYFDLVSIVC